jgi:glycyl-tRNA synthetase
MTLGQALAESIIDNETLAYFMARSYLFLAACGIRKDCIRFRQHRDDEKAHESMECWDAEVETSDGWIEIAGHADRSPFDLIKHSERTKIDLQTTRPLKITVTLDKTELEKTYKYDS